MRHAVLGWVLAAALAAAPSRAEDAFRVIELPGPGRTASAGLADLDGDGRTDVYAFALFGLQPHLRRELRVHFQDASGGFSDTPDFTGPLPEGTAAFDVADLPDGPGQELVLLRRHGLSVLTLAERRPAWREIAIPGDPTAAAAADERGLDRLRLAREGLGDELRLLVPGFGETLVLTPAGRLLARLAVGHRANYFIPKRPGPLIGESELESYNDFPRLEIGDVDGDGRGDVIASTRHEIRVFLQRPDGGFENAPDRKLAIGRLTERDQIRGSGNVRVAATELDGDGKVDLVVVSTTGGIVDARSETTLHLNRGGTWNLDRPDHRSVLERGWSSVEMVDLDGDGRSELLEARLPFSIFELVETLLTREADVKVAIYRKADGRLFAKRPWVEIDLHVGLDFETLAPAGFVPSVDADLNGDGLVDRIDSADGKALEVYPGGGDRPLASRAARQALDTRGSIRFGDVDGDGLTDALLFDRDRPDAPLRVLVNRGLLPGTPPRPILTAPDA